MFGPACLMSISTLTVWPLSDGAFVDDFAVAAHHDLGAVAAHALVVEPVGDGLGLADDAEARRGRNRDAAVALVLVAGDQGMHGGLEPQRRGVRRECHAPVRR